MGTHARWFAHDEFVIKHTPAASPASVFDGATSDKPPICECKRSCIRYADGQCTYDISRRRKSCDGKEPWNKPNPFVMCLQCKRHEDQGEHQNENNFNGSEIHGTSH